MIFLLDYRYVPYRDTWTRFANRYNGFYVYDKRIITYTCMFRSSDCALDYSKG